jgi:hypothetical protein
LRAYKKAKTKNLINVIIGTAAELKKGVSTIIYYTL